MNSHDNKRTFGPADPWRRPCSNPSGSTPQSRQPAGETHATAAPSYPTNREFSTPPTYPQADYSLQNPHVYDVFTIQEPGWPQSFEHPSLHPDFSIQFDHIDGNIIGPIYASAIIGSDYNYARGQWVRDSYAEDVTVLCYASEARFVFVCRRYDRGGGWSGWDPTGLAIAVVANVVSKARAAGRSRGTALTGHLRYPWISFIGFEPKLGWMTDEILRLVYGTADERYMLELKFKSGVNAGSLAYTLMQRVVAYRLADRSRKSNNEIRELCELLARGPAGAPPPGKIAGYSLPGSIPAGAGAEHAPPAQPSTAYRLPSAAPVASGWYADPQGANFRRYWDGSRWTAHISQ